MSSTLCSVKALPSVASALFRKHPSVRSQRIRFASSGKRQFSMVTKASVTDEINNTVQSNKVVVYSKAYCPYCSEVKGLFKNLKVDPVVFELDQMADGGSIQSTLQSITGRRTVPQVFIGGKFVGGCDDTFDALNSGKLKTLFAEAGVSASF